ncbi:MAG: hypothetical protein ACLFVP_00465 [Candidatus Bathyarchaeia archaeon]
MRVAKSGLTFLLILFLFVFLPCTSVRCQEVIEVIDYIPYDIVDVAVSADGNYVAAVSHTHLMYFSVENKSIQWTFNVTEAHNQSYISHLLDILTVKISSNGIYVAIGYGESGSAYIDGGVSYFNESTKRNGDVIEPTWTSWFVKTNGRVDRKCLDISDDGESVTVSGTGTSIYFF